MHKIENLPLKHRLRVVQSEFAKVSNFPVVCDLVHSRFVTTSYLDLIEDVGTLVVLAIIGKVNVKFSFSFRQLILIGGLLGMTVIDFAFIDGRLQLEDGMCAIFSSQGSLEMLVWPQPGR